MAFLRSLYQDVFGAARNAPRVPPPPPSKPLTLSEQIHKVESDLEGEYARTSTLKGPVLQRSVERMLDLQKQIQSKLEAAGKYIEANRTNADTTISAEVVTLQKEIERDIPSLLASLVSEAMVRLCDESASYPLFGSTFLPPQPPPPQTGTISPIPGATGLANASANCWANALLQTVSFVPSLEAVYREFAQYKRDHGVTSQDRDHGAAMIRELDAFQADQRSNMAVSTANTQNIRLAFHHFFGHTYYPDDPVGRTGRRVEVFSASAGQHEDAHEALSRLMDGHDQVRKAQRLAMHPIYRDIDTIRCYRPTGKVSAADPVILQRTKDTPMASNTYSRLRPDHTSVHRAPEFQIFLDPQHRGHLGFDELFSDFFKDLHTATCEPGKYLEPDDRLHEYALTSVNRRYATAPDEFVLTAKRFGTDITGRGFKIETPIPIRRYLTLPAGSIAGSFETPCYELDAFIVHSGGLSGGHYISYQKRNGAWVEISDRYARTVPDTEIARILQRSYIHHYRKIDRIPSDLVVLPSTTVECRRAEALIDSLERRIKDLEAHVAALPSGSGTPVLYKDDSDKLHEMVWLRDAMPQEWGYGQRACEKDPRTLLAPSPSFLAPAGSNLLEQLVSVRTQQLHIAQREAHVLALRQLQEALAHPSYPKADLLELISRLPVELRNAWDGAVYQHDVVVAGKKRCNVHEYGRKTLDGDVRVLYDIKDSLPSLRSKCSPTEEAQFDQLVTLLASPSTESGALTEVIRTLSPDLINAMHGLIYEAHVQKFGKEACNRHEYGKHAIAANPRVLLEVRTASSQGLLEKAVYEAEQAHAKAKQAYTKSRLEAFLGLLKNDGVSNQQLLKAFETLDIPKDLKEKLMFCIWQANGSPEEDGYGNRVFRENPRCLATPSEPVLAGPPLVEKGTSLLEQMIALIHRDCQ
jgi:ubiquitin C-terminal hydrolase